MTKRRSLTEGIKGVKTKEEEEFIYGPKPKRNAAAEPSGELPKKRGRQKPVEEREPFESEEMLAPPPPIVEPVVARPPSRVPFTTRIRSDLALALKQASLKRQLAGQEPNTVQHILEEALEPWLKSHGYLPK